MAIYRQLGTFITSGCLTAPNICRMIRFESIFPFLFPRRLVCEHARQPQGSCWESFKWLTGSAIDRLFCLGVLARIDAALPNQRDGLAGRRRRDRWQMWSGHNVVPRRSAICCSKQLIWRTAQVGGGRGYASGGIVRIQPSCAVAKLTDVIPPVKPRSEFVAEASAGASSGMC